MNTTYLVQEQGRDNRWTTLSRHGDQASAWSALAGLPDRYAKPTRVRPDRSNTPEAHLSVSHVKGFLVGCPACEASCHCDPDPDNDYTFECLYCDPAR